MKDKWFAYLILVLVGWVSCLLVVLMVRLGFVLGWWTP